MVLPKLFGHFHQAIKALATQGWTGYNTSHLPKEMERESLMMVYRGI